MSLTGDAGSAQHVFSRRTTARRLNQATLPAYCCNVPSTHSRASAARTALGPLTSLMSAPMAARVAWLWRYAAVALRRVRAASRCHRGGHALRKASRPAVDVIVRGLRQLANANLRGSGGYTRTDNDGTSTPPSTRVTSMHRRGLATSAATAIAGATCSMLALPARSLRSRVGQACLSDTSRRRKTRRRRKALQALFYHGWPTGSIQHSAGTLAALGSRFPA
jgi:hypothetical protein